MDTIVYISYHINWYRQYIILININKIIDITPPLINFSEVMAYDQAQSSV